MKRFLLAATILAVMVIGMFVAWFIGRNASDEKYYYPTWGARGFVDPSGNPANLGSFADGRQFSDGRAGVKIGERWGFIDLTGKLVIAPQFEDVMGFSEGLCPVLLQGKWGYIDWEGRLVVEPQFERAYPFNEGLAPYKKGSVWGFINRDGTVAIPAQFNTVTSFSEGMAAVSTQPGMRGYIDRRANLVIKPFKCDIAREFHYGSAKLIMGGRQRRIDWQGRLLD